MVWPRVRPRPLPQFADPVALDSREFQRLLFKFKTVLSGSESNAPSKMASLAVQTGLEQPVAQKFSRYKAVRRQNSNNGPVDAPLATLPLPSSPPKSQTVARSMSRYHRKSPPKPDALDPVPQIPSPTNINPSHAASLAALTGETCHLIQSPPRKITAMAPAVRSRPSQEQLSRGHPSQTTGSSSQRTNKVIIPYGSPKQEATDILRSEQERMQRLKAQQDALQRIRREEAKQKQLELLKMEEENQSKAAVQTQSGVQQNIHVPNRPKRSLVIGRRVDRSLAPANSVSQPIAPQHKVDTEPELPNDSIVRKKLGSSRHKASESSASSRKRKILIGAPGLVDGEQLEPVRSFSFPTAAQSTVVQPATEPNKPKAFDAPISAVNAGDRRVLVRCNVASIALPVTPTTTAQDLLNSASVVMSESIDPRTAVLVESFTQLRLERPIRRYEHIRDVLNSWDNDEQNVFLIMPHSDRPEGLLEIKSVPKCKPTGASFVVHHSQKPGKWNKRHVNLREDGQMTISKKEGDSDTTNICHLSDFDIYGPTHKQMKRIKSPKKICFAIKSQQKSTMFLDSAAMNFVHFVSTNDWELADKFYLAVQSWRSWYLVSRLGEGQRIHAKPVNAIEAMQRPGTASSAHSIPYQLGSFSPLLDFDLGQLSVGLNTDGTPKSQAIHRRNMSSRDRRAPPSAFPNQRMEEASPGSVVTARGRPPSVKNRSGSMGSNVERPTNLLRSTSLNRTGSARQKLKPLLDLTPQFKEAPQHIRIGRGVKASNGQPLVELATEVEREPGSVVVPPLHDWRRPDTRSPAQANEDEAHAFTGKGLLARNLSKRAQGASRYGHGAKGSDGKPLVDLNLSSKFADGSLLRQVEAWKGDDERGLVVDREKRVERSMKVGEGF